MRWGLSISLVMLSVLTVSSVARGQGEGAPKPVNPFGGGGGDQPPAPPPANPFATGDVGPQAAGPAGPGRAAADSTGGDPAKQKQLLDDMLAKKVVFKANVKGRTASLWVGNGFAELPDEQQISVARAAYKIWIIGEEAKFKGPMTVLLSDGEKVGARFATYFITLKGDGMKLARPKRQPQQPGFDPSFLPPAQPAEPPGDPNDPFNQ